MAVPGTKPKPDDAKTTRVPLTQEWNDVLDVPYAGEKPGVEGYGKETSTWWSVVSSMPHCVLWSKSDWQFAIDSARVHAAFVDGKLTAAAELRVREKQMGTTLDARRDLRIRYVEVAKEPEAPANAGDVADFEAARRKRLMEAE